MKKILTLVFIALVLVFAVSLPLLIKIRVDCQSQYGVCPQEITDKLNQYNGHSLSAAKGGIRKFLKSDFLISAFSLQFKLPNILHADILVKKAVGSFKNSGGPAEILVDKDGVAISTATDSALPVITITGNLPKTGQQIDAANLFAVKLSEGIYQMYQIRESSISNGSLLVELPGQIRVIFPLDGDSDILLGSLRLIYSKIESDGNPLGYSQIDLRFKNPVLR